MEQLPEKQLTEQEMLVVQARVRNPTWTKSRCYRAGYPDGSKNSSYSSSTKFFDKEHIIRFMNERHKQFEKTMDIDAQYVIRRLMKIIEFNPQCMINKDGTPIPLHNLDPEDARMIESVGKFEIVYQEDEAGEKIPYLFPKQYKTGSKTTALELIGKYLKMFTDKQEIDLNTKNLPDRIFKLEFVKPDKKD